ncbi:recombinase family protein [Flavobacterium undicola]|nr:recombinase family protein [Flavobacterium undicola]
MLAQVENGSITEINISSIDRLGRKIIELLMVIEFLNQRSINFF